MKLQDLVGKRITRAVEEDFESDWSDDKLIVLYFDDNSMAVSVLCDPEGNGPGTLIGHSFEGGEQQDHFLGGKN